jgi:hypothetical protein
MTAAQQRPQRRSGAWSVSQERTEACLYSTDSHREQRRKAAARSLSAALAAITAALTAAAPPLLDAGIPCIRGRATALGTLQTKPQSVQVLS